MRGEFLRRLSKAAITAPCDVNADGAYQELVTTLKVDERGARTDAVEIDYALGADKYTLEVEDSYIACGSSIDDATYCP